MNDALHQRTWSESLEQCLALLEERRARAHAEFAELAAKSGDPFNVFDADDLPEKYDDPIADGLCRLHPAMIDASANYCRGFLEDLRDKTQGKDTEETQAYVLEALRDELSDTMFCGVAREQFELIMASMVELESQYAAIAQKHSRHLGDHQRRAFFTPISQYCELATSSMHYLHGMLDDYQTSIGVDEADKQCDLFRVAQEELIADGSMQVADNDDVMSESEIDLCRARAQEIYTELFSSLEDALPETYCPELPWFVGALREHHERPSRVYSTHLPVAQNDNETMAHEHIMRDLTRTFVRHLETADDVRAVLAAEKDVQHILDQHAGAGVQLQR